MSYICLICLYYMSILYILYIEERPPTWRVKTIAQNIPSGLHVPPDFSRWFANGRKCLLDFALPLLDPFWHQFCTKPGHFSWFSINADDILENGVQLLHIFATFGKSWDHGMNPGGSDRTNGSKIGLKMKPDFDDFSIFSILLTVHLPNGSKSGFSSHLDVNI